MAAIETDTTASWRTSRADHGRQAGSCCRGAAAVPIIGLLLLTGRWLGGRGGVPLMAPVDDDEPLDPWEQDLEDGQ